MSNTLQALLKYSKNNAPKDTKMVMKAEVDFVVVEYDMLPVVEYNYLKQHSLNSKHQSIDLDLGEVYQPTFQFPVNGWVILEEIIL